MRLGAICLELENRLSQEVEYLAAEINITDNPFGGKVDFKERFRPGDADIRDFFGRNVGVSGNGLGNIVLKAHFYKALEISPKNSRAWIAKMKAIEYIGTLGELKLMEVVEAGKNAVAFADEVSQKEITFEVYSYEAIRSLELLKLAMNKMADTEDVEKTCLQFAAINILTANKNTLDVDSKVVNIYDNIAKEALAMIQLIPDEVLADYPEITKIIGECAKQYQYVTDALIKRFKLYGAELQESAKTMRENNKTAIENEKRACRLLFTDNKPFTYLSNFCGDASFHADSLQLSVFFAIDSFCCRSIGIWV